MDQSATKIDMTPEIARRADVDRLVRLCVCVWVRVHCIRVYALCMRVRSPVPAQIGEQLAGSLKQRVASRDGTILGFRHVSERVTVRVFVCARVHVLLYVYVRVTYS
jgi:hypothetical protein